MAGMRTIHMCLSVTGLLGRTDKELRDAMRGVITVDGKCLKTAKEIRQILEYQLSLGREVLPFGDCDNFDYKTGCQGHDKPEGA